MFLPQAQLKLTKTVFRLLNEGRIPVIVDNTVNPPFSVHETSAELLYLLKFADKSDALGFSDELERIQCLQWMVRRDTSLPH